MGIKRSLIKELTQKELQELCSRYKLKGYSGKKHSQLVDFLCENLAVPDEEVEGFVVTLVKDRLTAKIKDANDYFLTKRVHIVGAEENLIKANVGGYNIIIENLGRDDFNYTCDERCQDWLYQVKKGRYPFCKHYPAVLAELIFSEMINVDEIRPNYIDGDMLGALRRMVETRKRQEGLIFPKDRSLEERFGNIESDLLPISLQNQVLARDKYHERAELVFENLVNDAFLLLECETIQRRKTGGWDLLVMGTNASPPFIAVVECKTAADGIYEQVLTNPNYLCRLREYCIDLTKNRLIGALADYVKYMVIVAPGFPMEVNSLTFRFSEMTGGLHLSFLPVDSLIHLLRSYHKAPIITHSMIEKMLLREKLITQEDVEQLVIESQREMVNLANKCKGKLREKLQEVLYRTADASFIKLDTVLFEKILTEVVKQLAPDLVRVGTKEAVGVSTYSLMHDYYKVWEYVLNELVKEFVAVLKEQSEQRVKRTELKEEMLNMLDLR